MRNVIKVALVAFVLVVGCAAPVAAGPFEDGMAAYNQGDYATASRLLRPLAEQGHTFAQFNLGRMYHLGKGVPQDHFEAHKWYRLAAEQGHADAQNTLGTMYSNGRGVPQDNTQAHMWFSIAASRYSASEPFFRDMAVKNRDAAAAKMTPAQVAEAQKLAREWVPK
jgi:hypothetical protein